MVRMRKKDIELEQLVGVLSSIETRNKYPGWFPVAQMLRRMFGVDVVLSFLSELGEARLRQMGVRGFIGYLKVYGYERKAELEKSGWVDERGRTKEGGHAGPPRQDEFTSLGDILGR